MWEGDRSLERGRVSLGFPQQLWGSKVESWVLGSSHTMHLMSSVDL